MNEPNDMLELPDAIEACPACGCEDESNFLGALGTALHYRCRDCGMMWMNKDEPEPKLSERELLVEGLGRRHNRGTRGVSR